MFFRYKSISCLNWSAYIPTLETLPASHHSSIRSLAQRELDTTMIPPAYKRRCSQASKIALSVALKTVADEAIDYSIFCSQHGEIATACLLFSEMKQPEMVSPMRFSQSVHNAASGLFGIQQHSTIPTTTLSAQGNTFFAAMIEALTWLQLNPNKMLLLTIFDAILPTPYQAFNIQYKDEYGISLLLSNQNHSQQPSLSAELHADGQKSTPSILPSAIVFLDWFLKATAEPFIQSTTEQHLLWRYHHA